MAKLFDLIFSILEFLVAIFGGAILIIVYVVPWILGLYLIYTGKRFKKSAKEAGVKIDITAFWFNWIAWIWMWAERVVEIVKAIPAFQKDLSETFGVKEDDGKIT